MVSVDSPDGTWVPLAEREEWKNVSPIFPSENETSVVPIAYSAKFKEVFAYLRAVLLKDEKSERVFQLTTVAVECNPANYTLWQYRRNLLKSLNKDLNIELKFTGEVIEDNPKNYQVWHHRRVLVEWMKLGDQELKFVAKILRDDAKNYHAWQHRQWVVDHFKLFDNELEFTNSLLQEDLRNNSAWNYRYFVISSTGGYTEDVLSSEVALTLELIRKAPHNESAWNYLNGILLDREGVVYPGVLDFCLDLREKKSESPHLLCFMADCYTELAERCHKKEDGQPHIDSASKLYDELIEVDPVRKGYWEYLRSRLQVASCSD